MVRAVLPELCLTALVLILLVLAFFRRTANSRFLGWFTTACLAGVALLAAIISNPGDQVLLIWGGMLRFDAQGFLFRILFLAGASLTALFTCTDDSVSEKQEFYLLLVVSTLGMSLMASAADMLMLFLAMETTSFPLYILAGAKLKDDRSTEAGIKYFLFGATSSALMLYGFSLLYGFSGTTRLYQVWDLSQMAQVPSILFVVSFVFVLAGFAFKISAVPFHFWAPDVYEGAPAPVAGFLSTASKAAGFAVLLRVLFAFFPQGTSYWTWIVILLAILSMFLGNLAAIPQKNIKRLIAYSSIAHAGYVLVGVAAGDMAGISAATYYLMAYLVTNLLVFAVIGLVNQTDHSSELSAFSGLSRRSPGLALVMMVGILSLAGIPPFAGFFAKILVLNAATAKGLSWLVIIAVINSVIGLYYYLRILKVMYLDPAPEHAAPIKPQNRWLTGAVVCVVCILVLGVLINPWMQQAVRSAVSLLQ
jgi:NADH-quinone oxidoreductase subunit N